MAITIYSQNPAGLLALIRKAIDDGKIKTWSYDGDGDFTHTPEQWTKKAWLRPKVGSGMLVLGLLGPTNVVMTKIVYGVYHGRFIEEMLMHFDDRFSNATATAQAQTVDDFKASS